MRATDLFADAPDWNSELDNADLAEASAALEEEYGVADFFKDSVKGLRVLELEDFDLSDEAIDAMESGEVETLLQTKAAQIEPILVKEEDDYSVRMALVDTSAGEAVAAVQKAMISEVDLIIVGPCKAEDIEGGSSELAKVLKEAARTGHGVFALTGA